MIVHAESQVGATLYWSSLTFSPSSELIGKHGKLIPKTSERLILGQRDSSIMRAPTVQIGRIDVAICWENYVTLYRHCLYHQDVQLWCAPTVDMREMWQTTTRHIAYGGRCFVLSACPNLTKEDWPDDLREVGDTIKGQSIVISPKGEILAGPIVGSGLIFADIDLDDIQRENFDFDVVGHYNRPDTFSLVVRDPV